MTREEAIRRLKNGAPFSEIYDKEWNEALEMAISALSENKGEWIPVIERLPEFLMVKTLVSCEDVNGLPINTMVAIYDAFNKTWDCEYKVIAWMPLPEPYKAESEEE